MKRIISLVLAFCLTLSLLAGLPVVRAEDDVPGLSDWDREIIQDYEQTFSVQFTPIAGGRVQASSLEDGKSYYVADSLELELDADRKIGFLYAGSSVTVEGDHSLTAEALRTPASICVKSGTLHVANDYEIPEDYGWGGDLFGQEGVLIAGGEVHADSIFSVEHVSIEGGAVYADSCRGHYNFSMSGGKAELGEVHGRDGTFFFGGEATVGTWFLSDTANDFTSGSLRVGSFMMELNRGFVRLPYPMLILEPADAVLRDGKIVGPDGKEVQDILFGEDPAPFPFRDVAEDAYYRLPVAWANHYQITSGISQDQFGPASPCTRAQAVTFLWRARGCPEPPQYVEPDGSQIEHPVFTDVPDDAYYAKAVAWAVAEGITRGTSETTFSPGKPCTRAQIVTFLFRTLYGDVYDQEETSFADVQKNQYYYYPVAWATVYGITQGVDPTHFAPDKTCTRAQIVTFLWRALDESRLLPV